MKVIVNICFVFLIAAVACTPKTKSGSADESGEFLSDSLIVEEEENVPAFTRDMVVVKKDLQYDQHTLEDVYPYKDTTRMFQWEKIKDQLFFLDSIQQEPAVWATVQNYKNMNGEGPVVRNWHRNEHRLVADAYEVSRYQSAPLFLLLQQQIQSENFLAATAAENC